MAILYIDNDHEISLVGLRNANTFAFVNGATVEARLLEGSVTGSEVAGQSWPLTLSNTSITGDAGGETGGETVVKSTSKLDVVVTVGTTNALSLSQGDVVEFLHDEPNKWKVAYDVSGAAETDVEIHLEPYIYDGTEPTKISGAVVGEPLIVTDGIYTGVLDSGLLLVNGTEYYAEISATVGSTEGKWFIKTRGKYRL